VDTGRGLEEFLLLFFFILKETFFPTSAVRYGAGERVFFALGRKKGRNGKPWRKYASYVFDFIVYQTAIQPGDGGGRWILEDEVPAGGFFGACVSRLDSRSIGARRGLERGVVDVMPDNGDLLRDFF